MRNEVVTLIVKDVSGSTVTEKEYNVFAEKKSVVSKEFYAAYEVGLHPKYVFEISTDDWLAILAAHSNDPTELIHNNRRYNILRAYERFESTEVTCGE